VVSGDDCSTAKPPDSSISGSGGEISSLTFYAEQTSRTIQAVSVAKVSTVLFGGDAQAVPKPGEAPTIVPVLSVDLAQPVSELTVWVKPNADDGAPAAADDAIALPAAGNPRRRLLQALRTTAGAAHGRALMEATNAAEAGGADRRSLSRGILGVRIVTQGPPDSPPLVSEWGRVPTNADEQRQQGLRRIDIEVGSGRLAGVSFFEGIGKGKGARGGRRVTG
jgi:hypothetical protein